MSKFKSQDVLQQLHWTYQTLSCPCLMHFLSGTRSGQPTVHGDTALCMFLIGSNDILGLSDSCPPCLFSFSGNSHNKYQRELPIKLSVCTISYILVRELGYVSNGLQVHTEFCSKLPPATNMTYIRNRTVDYILNKSKRVTHLIISRE